MKESIFIKMMGDYPLIRILNHLLIFREFDYSMTDIAKESGVAWSTLNLLWPKIEKMSLVEYTRDVGRAKMYRLNIQDKKVHELVKFADAIVWANTNKSMKKKVLVN